MNAGEVTGRVYEALKRDILSGQRAPGSRLDPSKLADALASSATPVRDALFQLTGERLVEARPSEGFFLPQLHEPGLRDRYRYAADLLRSALTNAAKRPRPLPIIDPSNPYETSVRALFSAIALRSSNSEHVGQVTSLNDRLAAVRHAEARVLGGLREELNALDELIRSDNPRAAVREIGSQSRRREKAVPDILKQLYEPS